MSFIYDYIIIDIESETVLGFDGSSCHGPVMHCKREKEKSISEKQMAEQNALQREAFNLQKSQLESLKGALESRYLTGDEGFSPEQTAMLNANFLDEIAGAKQSAGRNVRSALGSRGFGGGDLPVGGAFTRQVAGMESAFGTAKATGLRDIRLANIAQALTNKFNTANILSGNAATLSSPIASFGSGAANALNQRIYAGTAPTILSGFMGGLGQGLGQGISGGIFGAGDAAASGGGD